MEYIKDKAKNFEMDMIRLGGENGIAFTSMTKYLNLFK